MRKQLCMHILTKIKIKKFSQTINAWPKYSCAVVLTLQHMLYKLRGSLHRNSKKKKETDKNSILSLRTNERLNTHSFNRSKVPMSQITKMPQQIRYNLFDYWKLECSIGIYDLNGIGFKTSDKL